jgi:tetratricopeptide (TPR) repeat protein
MKAEHRHELKTNELAEWLINFPKWARENARMIIYLSVLAVVVAGVYFWKVYEKRAISDQEQLEFTSLASQISQGKTRIIQAQAQGMDTSYILIQAADNFKNIAQETKDEQLAAMALIEEGNMFRTELHYRLGTISAEDIAAQRNRAKDCYTKALEKSSTSQPLTATAKFGLGLCEEELGNFDQARQIYSEITEDPAFESTVAAAEAKLRLLTMANYQSKVVFKPSPVQEAPAVLPQPEIKLPSPEGLPQAVPEVPESNLPSQ